MCHHENAALFAQWGQYEQMRWAAVLVWLAACGTPTSALLWLGQWLLELEAAAVLLPASVQAQVMVLPQFESSAWVLGMASGVYQVSECGGGQVVMMEKGCSVVIRVFEGEVEGI